MLLVWLPLFPKECTKVCPQGENSCLALESDMAIPNNGASNQLPYTCLNPNCKTHHQLYFSQYDISSFMNRTVLNFMHSCYLPFSKMASSCFLPWIPQQYYLYPPTTSCFSENGSTSNNFVKKVLIKNVLIAKSMKSCNGFGMLNHG